MGHALYSGHEIGVTEAWWIMLFVVYLQLAMPSPKCSVIKHSPWISQALVSSAPNCLLRYVQSSTRLRGGSSLPSSDIRSSESGACGARSRHRAWAHAFNVFVLGLGTPCSKRSDDDLITTPCSGDAPISIPAAAIRQPGRQLGGLASGIASHLNPDSKRTDQEPMAVAGSDVARHELRRRRPGSGAMRPPTLGRGLAQHGTRDGSIDLDG